MNAIGGYFGLDKTHGCFAIDGVAVNSARNALRYIIRAYSIKAMWVPYYTCPVVWDALRSENIDMHFYSINENLFPIIPSASKNAFVLANNYFGICGNNVQKLSHIYPNLIVDNVHAYYSQPKGLASFNSARKFVPEKNGAYLWFRGEKNYFEPNLIRRKRFDNYHKKFFKTNLLRINISPQTIPFCYPYLAPSIEEADKIAFDLINKGLKIYRYWNNLPETYNEYKFYSRLVPIPLD